MQGCKIEIDAACAREFMAFSRLGKGGRTSGVFDKKQSSESFWSSMSISFHLKAQAH